MTDTEARIEFPTWASQELRKTVNTARGGKPMNPAVVRFFRKYIIAILSVVLIFMYGWIVYEITRINTTRDLRAQYEQEYAAALEAYKASQALEVQAEYFLSGEASREAALNQEADEIARLIGPMKTKRMKQSMIWNVLTRVDNAAYPDSVADVIAQPQQWMFWSESNPIREDDRQLALAELTLWHEGRYPAGLDTSFVFGEWSENDYVLRNSWDKTSRTQYWRMPE